MTNYRYSWWAMGHAGWLMTEFLLLQKKKEVIIKGMSNDTEQTSYTFFDLWQYHLESHLPGMKQFVGNRWVRKLWNNYDEVPYLRQRITSQCCHSLIPDTIISSPIEVIIKLLLYIWASEQSIGRMLVYQTDKSARDTAHVFTKFTNLQRRWD